MSAVGVDKRTQYYQLEPAEAIRTLKSHKMGLTNPEAARRYAQNANVIPDATPAWWQLLMQAAGHPLVALPAVAALLASALQVTMPALLLLCIALLHITLRHRESAARYNADSPIKLPYTSRVVRNGQIRSVRTSRIVVGDIVEIGSGDTVPADVRLLELRGLAVDEHMLFGGTQHAYKFIHALKKDHPLTSQHNMAWAGTTVTHGSARGVVVATGARTQLGRSSVLAQASQSHTTRHAGQYAFAALAGALLVLIALAGRQAGADASTILAMLLVLAAALAPNQLITYNAVLKWLARRALSRQQIIASGDELASLGRTTQLVVDVDAITSDVVARAFTVGRTTYGVEAGIHQSTSRLTDDAGKPLNKRSIAELTLFFEACALATTSNVLRGTGKLAVWNIQGDRQEAAALVVARQAGIHTENVRVTHPELRLLPYDADRELTSSARHYGSDVVVFACGSMPAVLAHSTKLWDHGHVRALSAGDKTFFGKRSGELAFGYRILPSGTDVAALSAAEIEQSLTFLGSIETEPRNLVAVLTTAAHKTGLRTALCGVDYSRRLRRTRIADLSDEDLLAQLRDPESHFEVLLPEDILRTITVLQTAGERVGFVGTSLVDRPARALADVALVINEQTSEQSHISLPSVDQLPHAKRAGQKLLAQLQGAYSTALTATAASVALVTAGSIGLLSNHIPLPISLPLLLVMQLVVQPLVSHHPQSNDSNAYRIARGIALGLITYGAFLLFFAVRGLSLQYIAADNPLVLQAVAVSFVVVSLGLFLSEGVKLVVMNPLHRQMWRFAALGTLLLLTIYTPVLQQLFGVYNLGLADWLVCALALACYTGFCWLQHHSSKHSRSAIVALHIKQQETSLPPKPQ